MLMQFTILVATPTLVIGVLFAGYALPASRLKKAFGSRKAQNTLAILVVVFSSVAAC